MGGEVREWRKKTQYNVGYGFAIQWDLYSWDTLRTKASVPWMEVGLGFVNNKPTNKIFFFYSTSESSVVITLHVAI